jgi:hypothetical protein
MDKNARMMHLGAVRSISHLLHQPRRLMMGDYDLDTLESGRVLVDFDGEWARCWVIAGQPSFCQLSKDFYGDAFTCLWETGGQGREGCQVKLGREAQDWFANWHSQGGNPWSLQPEIHVRSQYGAVALLTVKIGEKLYDCRFQDVPRLTLDACTPAQGQLESLPASLPTFTPRPKDLADQGQALEDSPQALALLPEARGDLGELSSLNLYNLSVELNPDQTFQGEMEVNYTNSEPVPLDSLYFRLFPNGGASYGNGSLTVSK